MQVHRRPLAGVGSDGKHTGELPVFSWLEGALSHDLLDEVFLLVAGLRLVDGRVCWKLGVVVNFVMLKFAGERFHRLLIESPALDGTTKEKSCDDYA